MRAGTGPPVHGVSCSRSPSRSCARASHGKSVRFFEVRYVNRVCRHLAQGSVRGGNRRLGPAPRLPKSHASCGRNLALDSRHGGRGMTLSCFGKSFVLPPACTKRSVPIAARGHSVPTVRRRIRASFPRHDEHRPPRTGLSSWGEQAPRARASTASTCPHHLSGHDGGLR